MRPHLKRILFLVIFSYLFLMLGNGVLSLTDPDEVFYVQTAREMQQQHTWSTPYLFGQPQFEKPIFLYWTLRIAFGIFGMSNFGWRFFAAFFAILGVVALYLFGILGFKEQKRAYISAWILMSSALYIGLSRTVFTDMIFTVFILFSLLSFYWGYSDRKRQAPGILLCFIFSALAVLTKGPLGFLIPFLAIFVFLYLKKEPGFLFNKYSLWGLLIFSAISLPWYLLMIKKYGRDFTYEFFYNDHIRRLIEAEHRENDTWYFYPSTMIGCMFPWSLFVFFALIDLFRKVKRKMPGFLLFLFLWIIVTFLIFQPAHSKLTSYIFPLFPALALVTGGFLCDISSEQKKSRLVFGIGLGMLLLLLLLPIALLAGFRYYSAYITDKGPVYLVSAALFILAGVFAFLLWRRRLLKAMLVFSFCMPIMLTFVFLSHKGIEPYVSSESACAYLLNNYKVGKRILCSKPYARGVRMHTDKEVAVVDTPGLNYFSPHPVPFLNTEELIRDYLLNEPVTYCVLKKSSVEKVELVLDKKLDMEVLKKMGKIYLVRVRRIDSGKMK